MTNCVAGGDSTDFFAETTDELEKEEKEEKEERVTNLLRLVRRRKGRKLGRERRSPRHLRLSLVSQGLECQGGEERGEKTLGILIHLRSLPPLLFSPLLSEEEEEEKGPHAMPNF